VIAGRCASRRTALFMRRVPQTGVKHRFAFLGHEKCKGLFDFGLLRFARKTVFDPGLQRLI